MTGSAPKASSRFSVWLPDVLSSVVVVLVAIPLCIGIAVACGVPPERGLITGIIGGLVVGLFAGSPLLVSGPAASLIVPVFDLVQTRGLAALAPVVMLAGVWQLIAGRLKLGQWFRAVAPAVIHGMLIGIGILIMSSQLHVAVDGDPAKTFWTNISTFPQVLAERFAGSGDYGLASVLVGLGTIVLLVAWNRWRPRPLRLVPGQLMAILILMAIVALIGAPVRFLKISSDFFAGLQLVSADSLRGLLSPSMIGLSLMFAFVASAATLLTAVAIDQRQSHQRTDYNRELMAQGLGNTLAGAVGGLPMTGVIVRSSVNVDAGARTRKSTMLHGLWILLFVAVAPQALSYIPRACLGAILVYTGFKLVDYRTLRMLYERGRAELAICLITIFGVVFIELFAGILMGLAAALAKIIYTFSHLELRYERSPSDGEHRLALSGSATFLRLPVLAETLDKVPGSHALHLDIERLEHIDHACLELFTNWEQRRKSQGHKGLIVDWGILTNRYHSSFLGMTGEASSGQESGAVMSLMMSEWKRVYGPSEQQRASLLPADWIDSSRVRLQLEARRLDDVLEVAAQMLAPVAKKPATEIAAALRARSEEGQIVVGDGVSIPHGAVAGLDRPLAAMITTQRPLDLGGQATDLFFVLLVPERDPRRHLLALAHVGRICHDPGVLRTLRATSNIDAVVAILEQAEERFEPKKAAPAGARLLAVVELSSDAQVKQVVEMLDEGLTHPVVLTLRDGAPFEALRKVLHLPPSRRLALLAIEERDKHVLAGLIAEFTRQWGDQPAIALHVLHAETADLARDAAASS